MPENSYESRIDLSQIKDIVDRLGQHISKVIVGQQDAVHQLIAAILADGHVLLEGVPGIAKTLMVRVLARGIDAGYKRIQFTPDLMPSDVLGTSVFHPKTTEFEFNPGPIFSNTILIDEINRAPAKTQAALFEVMEERQVTVDGTTYDMDKPFNVFATQNPIDFEGTYSLPEAQLDRFLFKVKVGYPDIDSEVAILELKNNNPAHCDVAKLSPVISKEELSTIHALVHSVHVEKPVIEYIARLVIATRNHSSIFLGASPRASASLLISGKALAAMDGRDFVTPDDLKFAAKPVLRHRLILTPDREMEGISPDMIIDEILRSTEVPR